MKTVALPEVKEDLSKYLRAAEKEEIVITRHGKEVACRQSSIRNVGHKVIARETCSRIKMQKEFTGATANGSDQSDDSCQF